MQEKDEVEKFIDKKGEKTKKRQEKDGTKTQFHQMSTMKLWQAFMHRITSPLFSSVQVLKKNGIFNISLISTRLYDLKVFIKIGPNRIMLSKGGTCSWPQAPDIRRWNTSSTSKVKQLVVVGGY
jgi:hypothetical protein